MRGCQPSAAEALAAAGGARRYWRIFSVVSGGTDAAEQDSAAASSVIGCVSPDPAENRTFAALSAALREGGACVPEVYAVSADGVALIQQDLGTTSMFSLFATASVGELEEMVGRTMESLARLQATSQSLWEGAVAHAPLSRRSVMWDLNYFKYEYLKPSGIPFDEDALEDDFEKIAREVMEIPQQAWGFMYRDCQSRNVMWHEGGPWWIDFQGGRKGSALYDAVSFLYQARAPFDDGFRRRMLDKYAGEFGRLRGIVPDSLLAPLGTVRLLRLLQVLGAYGLRGLVEKRAHFLRSIPAALRQLRELISDGGLDGYPELKRVGGHLAADERFADKEQVGLTVTVGSFSYMRGYPDDFSGNGGGFMFDCRAMHNPGRYEQYKRLTGRDRAVIEFLEERGEVGPFIEHALGLVEPAVRRYLDRGFSSLQIGFGCTGGQHRSVYCAERVARRLREMFPEARIRLAHREQGIEEWL